MKLIDAHAHLQFSQFDEDRAAVIARARSAGIGVINVGTDLETSRAAVALAEKNDDMWATVGIHPTDLPAETSAKAGLPNADELDQTFVELEKLARQPKVVGIGECGLDYFRVEDSEQRKKQIQIFQQQVELAKSVGKPLMIHCRNAYIELLDILTSNFQTPTSNIHFFAGDWPTAKKFLDLGCTLSFTGVITFTNQYDEVIRQIPLNRLLVETDCPFVAPEPYRGKRNEPSYVVEVVRQIATLRGLAPAAVAGATLANTHRVFAL